VEKKKVICQMDLGRRFVLSFTGEGYWFIMVPLPGKVIGLLWLRQHSALQVFPSKYINLM